MTPNPQKKIAVKALNEAYLILKASREPAHFRDLLAAGWERAYPDTELGAAMLGTLYTLTNLDARFEPVGRGLWALTEWRSKPTGPGVPTTSLIGRTYDSDKDDLAAISDGGSPELAAVVAAAAQVDDEALSLDDALEDGVWSDDQTDDYDDEDYDDD